MTIKSQICLILHNLNFHPLEAVSRYRDLQLQVSDNYSIKKNDTKHLQMF